MVAIKKTYFIIIVLLLVSLSCSHVDKHENNPRAEKGIIRLKNWDFDKDGPLDLDGQWEFYWNQLIQPEDFDSGNFLNSMQYIDVPSHWNSNTINGKRLASTGYATYRLKIDLNQKFKQPAIKLMMIGTAIKVFVNNELVTTIGKVGTSAETSAYRVNPHIAPFSSNSKKLEIVLQVSNYSGVDGGIWDKIKIGNYQDLIKIRTRNTNWDFFLFGSIFIMGLYHIALFLSRRKNIAPLNFGIGCFFISCYSILTGEIYLVDIFPNLSMEIFGKVYCLSGTLGSLFLATYFYNIFPQEYSKRILRLIQGVFLALSVMVLLTPISFYLNLLILFNITFVSAGLYVLFCTIKSWQKKRAEAGIFTFGLSFFLVTVINDISKLFDLKSTTGLALAPFGIFVFVLFQAVLLSRRFTRAFSTVEQISVELENKNQELLKLDQIKDDFLSNTSHELRTPIHGIIGIAETIISNSAEKISGTVKESLSLIIYSGNRLSKLISDILDFSKLTNNDLTITKNPNDIKQLVGIVVSVLKPLSDAKSLIVNVNISGNTPPVLGDENRILQILHNLIGNAIKFTDKGSISISATEIDGMLVISIKDTGIGIPPDKQKIIFDSFKQADGSIARRYGGTGLGLSIVKKLVMLHNGSLKVTSTPGNGSTFSFSLPIASEKSNQHIQPAHDPAYQMQDLGPILSDVSIDEVLPVSEDSPTNGDKSDNFILVVDDDPINLKIVTNQLNQQSFQVISANSGKKALELIKTRGVPSLILLDIMMPEMSGFDFCKIIRKKYTSFELPIIYLTAKHQGVDIEKGFELGGNDYLTKPYGAKELFSRVQNQLQILTAGKRLQSLRNLSCKLGKTKDSFLLMEMCFREIALQIHYDQCLLLSRDKLIAALPENTDPIIKCGNQKQSLQPLFDEIAGELTISNSNSTTGKITEILNKFTKADVKNSSWILLQVEGFDDSLICLFRNPNSPPFFPDDIEYLRTLVKELKTIRSNLRENTLDITNNQKYIEIVSDLPNIIYIKGGGGGPYCTIAFDAEEKITKTLRISLQNIQTFFSEDHLMRIHHSYFVNPLKINLNEKPVVKKAGRSMKIHVLDNDKKQFELPVSKKYFEQLKINRPDWF